MKENLLLLWFFPFDFLASPNFRNLHKMTSETEIYFCGSIRAGRGDVDLYARIVEKLGKFGKVSCKTFTGRTDFLWHCCCCSELCVGFTAF